ncbi:MAG: virulence factor [Pseudomonadota bacterium]
MAQSIIVSWRDIPAQIIVKKGRTAAKRELPKRFITAIDACAMKVGAKDSEAYLAEWRRGAPEPCGDNLDEEADRIAAEIEQAYPTKRLKTLIDSEGFDEHTETTHSSID